jgi:sirohydrochlorin cobaltochelatase
MTDSAPRKGIVLFAHGSRDPLWHQPIEAVAQRIRLMHANLPVRCAYLELSTPDLSTVCQELAALGLNQLVVLPLFLGVGRHAREDLPRQIAALRSLYPQIQIELQPAIGENPQLVRLLAQIACDALSL